MSIVKVQRGFQITIPAPARREAKIEIGDVVEIKARRGKITLKLVQVVDKRVRYTLSRSRKQ
ncbi:MAG: AbrB/MazE/SpoVT family DNA-binding domain-containing protein [Acidobacteria bacterium]|nr:AbrB/MazE/SpoVT family DNA-binding domain-containing protein [Acidobacteriota bacterium]